MAQTRPLTLTQMASILDVCDTIDRMVDGFETAVMQTLAANAASAAECVREQIYSGTDGEGKGLRPTYRDDPFFDDPDNKEWYHRNDAYIEFKRKITPPRVSPMLGLPARADEEPNLYITGVFHSEIFADGTDEILKVGHSDSELSSSIVTKYGENILRLSPAAIGYLNETYTIPSVWRFFETCGW